MRKHLHVDSSRVHALDPLWPNISEFIVNEVELLDVMRVVKLKQLRMQKRLLESYNFCGWFCFRHGWPLQKIIPSEVIERCGKLSA